MENQNPRVVDPVALKIRELCIALNVPFAELSRRTGITTQAMQRWWNGESDPSIGSVRLCARALGVPVSAFLTDEDLPPERFKENAQLIEQYLQGPLGADLNEHERTQVRLCRVWLPGDRALDTREIHAMAEILRGRMRGQTSLPILNPTGTATGKRLKR